MVGARAPPQERRRSPPRRSGAGAAPLRLAGPPRSVAIGFTTVLARSLPRAVRPSAAAAIELAEDRRPARHAPPRPNSPLAEDQRATRRRGRARRRDQADDRAPTKAADLELGDQRAAIAATAELAASTSTPRSAATTELGDQREPMPRRPRARRGTAGRLAAPPVRSRAARSQATRLRQSASASTSRSERPRTTLQHRHPRRAP
jgi:hypothetical protein